MPNKEQLKSTIAELAMEGEQKALPGLLDRIFSKEMLQIIIAKLQEAGLGDEVKSWLDKAKKSIPVTAEQVRTALGEERMKQLADKFGISPETLAAILAAVLPHAAESVPDAKPAPAAPENPQHPQGSAPLPGPSGSPRS